MSIGPIVMSVAGDAYIQGAQIAAIVWVGQTTVGDRVEIRHRGDPANLIWKGRTDTENTYLGANIGPKGVHAPNGFYLEQINAGEVLVYLMES